MTAPHLFADDVSSERITIDGDDARHAVRVLRIRPGEHVTISDGGGAVVDAVVTEAGRTLAADVISRRFVAPSMPSLVVVQSILKGHKLDAIVQDLTEIGVDEIMPLRAARSVARWEDAASKLARLRVVAREAGKQSRRARLPLVRDPVTLEDAPVERVAVVLHQDAPTRLADALPRPTPERIAIYVGPEGGFDAREIEALSARGATAVTLGSQILRAETTPVVAAALILGRYDRIG